VVVYNYSAVRIKQDYKVHNSC